MFLTQLTLMTTKYYNHEIQTISMGHSMNSRYLTGKDLLLWKSEVYYHVYKEIANSLVCNSDCQ